MASRSRDSKRVGIASWTEKKDQGFDCSLHNYMFVEQFLHNLDNFAFRSSARLWWRDLHRLRLNLSTSINMSAFEPSG